jgi:hypothetical protein
MIARVVALNLRGMIGLGFLRVVHGFLSIALELLGLQDLLLLGNPRGFRRIGGIDVHDGFLRRRIGSVRVDHVALGIDRFVYFIGPRREGRARQQSERPKDNAARGKNRSHP